MFCAESREPLCRITCAPSATMCFQNLDFLRSSFSRSAPRNMFSPRRSHLVVSKRTFSMLFPPVNLQKRIMFLTVDFSARVSCMSCMYISAESRFPSSYDTRSARVLSRLLGQCRQSQVYQRAQFDARQWCIRPRGRAVFLESCVSRATKLTRYDTCTPDLNPCPIAYS